VHRRPILRVLRMTENNDSENEEEEDAEIQMKRSDQPAASPARAARAAAVVLRPVDTNSVKFSGVFDSALLF